MKKYLLILVFLLLPLHLYAGGIMQGIMGGNQYYAGVPFTFNGLTYIPLIAADGKMWLDRNLGATQVATAYNDSAAYGDYYQWGRLKDGHEVYNSSTTATHSASDTPGNNLFITEDPGVLYDWRSPQNNNLWQGVSGTNNPCPSGFRIPTSTEWGTLATAESITNRATAMSSTLKLPAGGPRDRFGNLTAQGISGNYHTSTISGTQMLNVYITNISIDTAAVDVRIAGKSVRCIKN